MEKIRVALVLREKSRSNAGRARAIEAIEACGFEVASLGRATISALIPQDAFSRLFGVKPSKIDPRPTSDRDAGRAGGWHVGEELAVPSRLESYVQSISVVPPATRFGDC
jgi:hypothetical protein